VSSASLLVPPERRNMSMIFQSYAVWPHMTVAQNVAYGLKFKKLTKHEIDTKVIKLLGVVHLGELKERYSAELSGGQQQRVALARALVVEPQILLMDEPLSNLDARLRTQMGDEFRALQKRLGITSLYVTHDQEEAMALSDRVVVMQAGSILQVGAPEEIYQRPASRAVAAFFGSPNLLDAKVTGCAPRADQKFELLVAGKGWTGHCLAGEPFGTGEPVLVLVRPENLHIGANGGEGTPMVWSGRITNSIFRGPRQSMVVQTDGLRLNVEAPALLGARIGDQVRLGVPPAGAWAIRLDGARSTTVQ
jgi:iron(III) transport system ATP-binding protein